MRKRMHIASILTLATAMAAVAVAADTSTAMKPKCAAGDAVVWVDTASKIYYRPGNPNYGKTRSGRYQCESKARASGAQAVNATGGGRKPLGTTVPRTPIRPVPSGAGGANAGTAGGAVNTSASPTPASMSTAGSATQPIRPAPRPSAAAAPTAGGSPGPAPSPSS
jgi:hypothetical protein